MCTKRLLQHIMGKKEGGRDVRYPVGLSGVAWLVSTPCIDTPHKYSGFTTGKNTSVHGAHAVYTLQSSRISILTSSLALQVPLPISVTYTAL